MVTPSEPSSLTNEASGQLAAALDVVGAGDRGGVAPMKFFQLGGRQLGDLPTVERFESRAGARQRQQAPAELIEHPGSLPEPTSGHSAGLPKGA